MTNNRSDNHKRDKGNETPKKYTTILRKLTHNSQIDSKTLILQTCETLPVQLGRVACRWVQASHHVSCRMVSASTPTAYNETVDWRKSYNMGSLFNSIQCSHMNNVHVLHLLARTWKHMYSTLYDESQAILESMHNSHPFWWRSFQVRKSVQSSRVNVRQLIPEGRHVKHVDYLHSENGTVDIKTFSSSP